MIGNIDSRRKQKQSFGHILPYLKFLAAKSRQAGRKTKRFFSILSQEADIKAAQREAIAATDGVGLPPQPLISEAALKAESLLFATGAILANAHNGSGSGSGSTKDCGLEYSDQGKVKDYKCASGTYCCQRKEMRGDTVYAVGYCCPSQRCFHLRPHDCGDSKAEYPWINDNDEE